MAASASPPTPVGDHDRVRYGGVARVGDGHRLHVAARRAGAVARRDDPRREGTYESLRDLAEEAGSKPVKVNGVRDQAVFAEIPSFKELLVLTGSTFLFLRLLDIENKVDAATAQTAMTPLGKSAAKRV